MNEPVHSRQQRRYYLDWLRVLLVLLVFVVHCAMPFNSARSWAIMNAETSFAVTACIGFCYQWGMPLFFLVAGASAGVSLRSRSTGQYLGGRFQRLVVPYLAGMLTIVPLQTYIEELHRRHIQGSFLHFYPGFFGNAKFVWDLEFNLDPYHLWFLRFLFVFSVITLPLFRWFMTETGKRCIAKAASAFEKPGVLFVGVLPIALIQVPLRAEFHAYEDWTDFLVWLVCFICGCILLADKRFERAVMKHGLIALSLGILCLLTAAVLYIKGHVQPWEDHPSYSTGCLLYELLRSVNTWSWVVFFLYLGMRFLNFDAPSLRYANEAALPIYILHHLVVMVFAFFVVQWHAGILPKFLAISLASLIVTLSLYEFGVRRLTALRFLFGMNFRQRLLAGPTSRG